MFVGGTLGGVVCIVVGTAHVHSRCHIIMVKLTQANKNHGQTHMVE